MRYFSKRLVTIHLLAIVAILICLRLSNWQWDRAHISSPISKLASEQTFEQLSPLRDFLPPSSIGVRTSVTGTWQEGNQQVFSNRPAAGSRLLKSTSAQDFETGNWILNFLTLDDGSSLAVVHGWNIEQSSSSVAGKVTLVGVMQPSEDSIASELTQLPSYITTNLLLENVQSNLHDGYFVTLEATAGLQKVEPIFDRPQKVSLQWRNVVYTGNWIVFAIIIAGMWWRIIQEELNQKKEKL